MSIALQTSIDDYDDISPIGTRVGRRRLVRIWPTLWALKKMPILLRALLPALFLLFWLPYSGAAEPGSELATPPRLSLIQGTVSLRRPSGLYDGAAAADGWVTPLVNTPMAVGDSLRVDANSLLELQFGPQSWLRLAAFSQLTLTEQTADFASFRLESGQGYLDIRALAAGAAVTMEIPGALVNIDRAGVYRLDLGQVGSAQGVAVTAPQTSLLARRGGRMTLSMADGQTRSVASGQELLLGAQGRVDVFSARSLDSWERWNDQRSDEVLGVAASSSRRYLPDGMYGAAELDRYGAWQAHPEYGQIWAPNNMASDWAPYSNGQWVNDPTYGASWVDQTAWGWAPFHYGRWIYLNNYWAWAPGPRIHRPVYAPALVGLVRSPHANVGFRSPFGGGIGWTPLGWGEPVTPWWGRPGFRGQASWGGWAGPRVIAPVYQNHAAGNAVFAARSNSMGYGGRDLLRVPQHQHRDWQAQGLIAGQAFGAPATVFGASAPVFGAPANVFGASTPLFGASAPVFGAPAQVYQGHHRSVQPSQQAAAPVAPATVYRAYVSPPHVAHPYMSPQIPQQQFRAPAMVSPSYRAPPQQAPPVYSPQVHAPPVIHMPSRSMQAPAMVAPQRMAPPPMPANPYRSGSASAPVYQGQSRGHQR